MTVVFEFGFVQGLECLLIEIRRFQKPKHLKTKAEEMLLIPVAIWSSGLGLNLRQWRRPTALCAHSNP